MIDYIHVLMSIVDKEAQTSYLVKIVNLSASADNYTDIDVYTKFEISKSSGSHDPFNFTLADFEGAGPAVAGGDSVLEMSTLVHV